MIHLLIYTTNRAFTRAYPDTADSTFNKHWYDFNLTNRQHSYLEWPHRETWFTQTDVDKLTEYGINTVRIPVGVCFRPPLISNSHLAKDWILDCRAAGRTQSRVLSSRRNKTACALSVEHRFAWHVYLALEKGTEAAQCGGHSCYSGPSRFARDSDSRPNVHRKVRSRCLFICPKTSFLTT